MGGSSRPEFKCKEAKETLDLFLESFESWRIKLDLDKFFLIAHSFGGYLSGHYAVKYPERI